MRAQPDMAPSPTLDQKISKHDNNFNLIRLLAASCVIYFHSFALSAKPSYDVLSQLVAPWSNAGGLALGIFFLISGIFVTQSFYRQRSWVDFIVKRTLRIWPGLVFCLLLTATLACLIESEVGPARFWRHASYWEYLWQNATMRLEFFIDGVFRSHPNTAINGSLHTLVLEVKMYGVVLALSFFGSLAGRGLIGLRGQELILDIFNSCGAHNEAVLAAGYFLAFSPT
jgi:peptidoglycan/LPS O-acetylase OafA/YrhL